MTTTDLEVVEQHQSMTLFRSDEPDEIIARATSTAGSLAEVIRSQKLATMISGREHVRVEGWTLLGTLLGVFPYTAWTRRMNDPEGWEARVEARTLDGRLVGSAEAQCTRDENMWGNTPTTRSGKHLDRRDDYALRSMAQTRATSKALRQPLGFVMALAGFESTPAEEMTFAKSPWQNLVDVAKASGIDEDAVKAAAKDMYAGRTPKSLTDEECQDIWHAVEAENDPNQLEIVDA